MPRFTTTQLEFDRLRLVTENSRQHFQPSPHKRPLQIAMEHLDDTRRVAVYLDKYPNSTRARRYVLDVIGRVANINGDHV